MRRAAGANRALDDTIDEAKWTVELQARRDAEAKCANEVRARREAEGRCETLAAELKFNKETLAQETRARREAGPGPRP